MRRLKVTLVVEVEIPDVLPPHLPPVADDEAGGRLVETIAPRALEREGLEPVSGGYGFSPSSLRESRGR
jgi:hypothetical protein